MFRQKKGALGLFSILRPPEANYRNEYFLPFTRFMAGNLVDAIHRTDQNLNIVHCF